MPKFIVGDCLEVMAGMAPESVDAVVTDPPYGLEFMGKHWDHHIPGIDFWREMFRVAKPSAYLLAFGGTRTVHRMTCAIEDAGWVVRDMLVWGYASGFPKSKASLKPAWEPIVMARKPGPLRDLAIDACRIPGGLRPHIQSKNGPSANGIYGDGLNGSRNLGTTDAARWPANIVLTDPIFDGGIEGVEGGGIATTGSSIRGRPIGGYNEGWPEERNFEGYGDSGTYSRFFLIPKASRSDREPSQASAERFGLTPGQGGRANDHPTVKPVELMRHLVRLITPPGGVVLDPFLGSGSTGVAAAMEKVEFIGIDLDEHYVNIARARVADVVEGVGGVVRQRSAKPVKKPAAPGLFDD
jgi:site-specific DNA-methyltransferase (adenine-specific)